MKRLLAVLLVLTPLCLTACAPLESGGPSFALRVNCGSTIDTIDNNGNEWLADQRLTGAATWGAVDGKTIPNRNHVKAQGVDAPEVFQSERYAMTAYKFRLPDGAYTVRLHFAETFEKITAKGQRVFSVTLGGKTIEKDLDLFARTGGQQKPFSVEVTNVRPVDGVVTVGFIANIQNPAINGIEIISE